ASRRYRSRPRSGTRRQSPRWQRRPAPGPGWIHAGPGERRRRVRLPPRAADRLRRVKRAGNMPRQAPVCAVHQTIRTRVIGCFFDAPCLACGAAASKLRLLLKAHDKRASIAESCDGLKEARPRRPQAMPSCPPLLLLIPDVHAISNERRETCLNSSRTLWKHSLHKAPISNVFTKNTANSNRKSGKPTWARSLSMISHSRSEERRVGKGSSL